MSTTNVQSSMMNPVASRLQAEEGAEKVLTSAGQDVPEAQPLWDTLNCSDLVYEIAKRVFQKTEGAKFEELSSSLNLAMEEKMKEWDIKVQPNERHIEKVAEAVYKDLLQERKKEWVARSCTKLEFNIVVIDCIYKHLVTPQKKRSRFNPLLQSVYKVIHPSTDSVATETAQVLTSTGEDVPEARPLYLWNRCDSYHLVYEIVKRVFQKTEGAKFEKLSSSLNLAMEEKMKEWDIKVQPNERHIKKVAEAVYSDLLLQLKNKEWVTYDAFIVPEFNTIVMDSIYKHLVTPQKKSRRFLQALGQFF